MAGMALILASLCLNSTNCNPNNTVAVYKNPVNKVVLGVTTGMAISHKAKQMELLRKEINGKKLRVVSLESPPLSYTEMKNGTRIGMGVAFEILKFLTEKFNFTYDVVVPEKNILGSTTDMPGSLIEVLAKDKADIAAAFLPILSDARDHIYYSTTSLDEGEWIMIMLRPAESASGNGLLAPFGRDVWLLILVSLLAVGPIIYCLIIIRYKLTKDKDQKLYPMPHCVWFVYGALMKQGSTLSPVADSTRIIFATWWIFITILTSFYTANLTAFLTLSKFTLPINDANDILRKEKPFVIKRGGGVEYAIKNKDEALTMLSKLVDKKLVTFTESQNDTDILLSMVEKKNLVFIRDRPAIDHLIYNDYRFRKTISLDNEKIHCPFAVSTTSFFKRKRAFAYPKSTKWNTLLDPELLHLFEAGIVKYMLLERLPKAKICPQNLGGTERQLRNSDLWMTYMVMLTGFCTGFVVFMTELIFKYLNKRNGFKKENIMNNNIPFANKQSKLPTITPPPPYASLFTRNKNPFGMRDLSDRLTENDKTTRKVINGRDYFVVKGNNGESRLIPMRAPSAALFQYSYTN